jgi:hypothetical protein
MPVKKRRNRAVFLGAGASKPLGYPLTAEILPEIRKRLDERKLFDGGIRGQKDRKQLASYLKGMFPGWKLPNVEPPIITDILSLVDYARMSSISPVVGKGPARLTQFRRLLELAICEVINGVYYSGPPEPLRERFIEWLLEDSQTMGMITTNYDIEVEMGIFQEFSYKQIEQGFDFGYEWRDPDRDVLYPRPTHPIMRIFKLHGSLNCLRCDLCEHTYINVEGPIDDIAADEDAPRKPYNSCDCGHHVLSMALVAPSMIRDIRNVDLLQTWKNALEWLRLAKRWYIIGYSFPPEDIAIRSMFMRAYQAHVESNDKPPKVTVVQCGRDQGLESRYRTLFPECKWVGEGLAEFVESIGY